MPVEFEFIDNGIGVSMNTTSELVVFIAAAQNILVLINHTKKKQFLSPKHFNLIGKRRI